MAAESPRSAPRRTPAAKSGAGLLSPRFRSAAELAGWDEESILLAALVVEDTPVRESRRKRRSSGSSAAGGSAGSNTRKRRSRRQSGDETPIPPVTLVLDDDEKPNDHEVGKKEVKQAEEEKAQAPVVEGKEKSGSAKEGEAAASGELPCMDRLREELSCAICLDICFQPSTTPCGHSFCMQCLKHAASKCGKRCPKCRQLISNSRSCTINTVLWNTIQLLFPSEVEARKSSMASSSASKDDVKQTLPRSNNFTQGGMSRNTGGSGSIIAQDYTRIGSSTRSSLAAGSRRSMPGGPGTMNTSSASFDTQGRSTRSRDTGRGFVQASQLVASRSSARSVQSDDASLAYRLQQEEFMTAFDNEGERQPQNTISAARANLRAMAARAERAVLTPSDNEGERQPQNTISAARANLRAMASRAERAVLTPSDNEGERQPQNTISAARANLRAMASRAERAALLRARGWPL